MAATARVWNSNEDDFSLRVVLAKDGQKRSWLIARAQYLDGAWAYRVVAVDRVTAGALTTPEKARAMRAQFELEIAAARADGWT
jgi:hypothetical protein